MSTEGGLSIWGKSMMRTGGRRRKGLGQKAELQGRGLSKGSPDVGTRAWTGGEMQEEAGPEPRSLGLGHGCSDPVTKAGAEGRGREAKGRLGP